MRGFHQAGAKDQTTGAVTAIEATTAAELVVVLRPSSGEYRHVDLLGGFVLSQIALALLLFLPQEFALEYFLVHTALAFVIGVLLVHTLRPLRRRLLRPRTLRHNVVTAARASFVEHAIGKTRGHTGILVYLSSFEQLVELVADRGIDVTALGAAWSQPAAAMQRAFAAGDLEGFLTALRSLGAGLAKALPRTQDDVNELPDQADVA